MRKFMVLVAFWFISGQVMAGMVSTGGMSYAPADSASPTMPYDGYKGGSVFEEVKFVKDESGIVHDLGMLDSGWYQLTLTDFVLPKAFSELKVAVMTATSLVTMLDLSSGTNQAISFLELGGTESYYLSIFGKAQGSGYALYGVQLSQFMPASPVPVPASLVLMLSGLLTWGASIRRRKVAA